MSMMKIAGSWSISQRHGSADPDPYQNVMDPQDGGWFLVCFPFQKSIFAIAKLATAAAYIQYSLQPRMYKSGLRISVVEPEPEP